MSYSPQSRLLPAFFCAQRAVRRAWLPRACTVFLAAFFVSGPPAFAQGAVVQCGLVVPGHIAIYGGYGCILDGGVPNALARYTVETLPACNSTSVGLMVYVTDATSPTYNGALTGAGSVVVPAFCNGSSWVAA